MKLRRKGLLITGTTTVCLLALLYGMSRQLLMSGFAEVEYGNTERNISRVIDAFHESVNNLSVKSADWAKWDDTYRFVQDRNLEYIESNLTDESLAELELDLMLFFDNTGDLVFGREYDLENETGSDVAGENLQVVVLDSSLLYHRSVENVAAGIMVFPRGLMNIVSRPVLNSFGQGPVMGTIVFGKYIDSSEVGRIGQITHLNLRVHPIGDTGRYPELARVNDKITEQNPFYIAPRNNDTISGYARLTNLHGNPVAVLRIDVPRDIYRQGIRTRNYLVMSMLFAGMIFGIVVSVLLQNTVLSRVTTLSTSVNAIATHGDNSARVQVDGCDEITDLGGSVNGMLASLQRVEAQVRSANSAMRMIMNTVPSGLLSIDAACRIHPEYSSSAAVILGSGELAGKDFPEVIGFTGNCSSEADDLRDYVQLLLREVLPESQMGPLNPLPEVRMPRNDGTFVWIRLCYAIIRHEDGSANQLLVIIEDITAQKALADRVTASERENMQLKAIAEAPDLFREFVADTFAALGRIAACLKEMETDPDNCSCVNELFREVHTIKGAAATFGLQDIVTGAGELEDTAGMLRDGGDLTGDLRRTITVLVARLDDAFSATTKSAQLLIGDDAVESADYRLRLSGERLTKELTAIGRSMQATLGSESAAAAQLDREICGTLRSLRAVTAKRGFAKTLRLLPGLLSRCEKKIVFTLDGADTLVDGELARRLSGALMHILRNVVDHGIEPPEERNAAGKAEEGSLRLTVRAGPSLLQLEVTDDGRGLDPVNLRRIGVEKGFLTPEEATRIGDDATLRLILLPGFSTAPVVTEISGRGVGMDVVAEVVEHQLHGTITLQSVCGKGTTVTLQIPLTGDC